MNKAHARVRHFKRFSVVIILVFIATFLIYTATGQAANLSGRFKALCKYPESYEIDVPCICQYPEFQTGCESVSAVMLLNYYKIDITAAEFIDSYLPLASLPKGTDTLYGANPNEYFIGDPRTSYSYGCFAPVIKDALNNCLKNSELTAIQNKEKTLDELSKKYTAKGVPILVWVSMNMVPIESGNSWTLENGETFTWPANEHCMLLIGYDKENYLFCDPMSGTAVKYGKDICEKRFAELDMQSIALIKD